MNRRGIQEENDPPEFLFNLHIIDRWASVCFFINKKFDLEDKIGLLLIQFIVYDFVT